MNQKLLLRFLLWLVVSFGMIAIVTRYADSHKEGLCSPETLRMQQESSQTH